ncbi:sugar ABC transporter substrate-binding protein [Ponticoccus sp. SC2-23]|uniref:sugar ABC transporter substrate-binding protein n=1 Tax=Alexandriicola marinus TaxID=2081710 RepID=UPI000FDBE5D7|nr:sugar ABC transporter substrate-binding protein [Alexandriicola marinus]MBM1221333.1 sugar ABC transporter substrate-binding protein [Ponticoccus sp. SC6-9]MBM1225903.1 sugar ABC transporter substrate-binding protein [Ponticoccus sp. SC6-15]MBM1228055.1 sugar ABC transporter substrate-binding protein [Ponticoccus sp. SC6-38]MBM1234307.1 sugar ABC transporter substrate-binding protein [Ponticoccus sp. SC6-45]MBM1238557.1 sugar ABC transporter substrate-binding protein [Ponticoccus sp. SC6-49
MKISTKIALVCSTAMLGTSAFADAHATYTIGITQNNVGVDSYQTTYEQAFIAAAEANDAVEVVVLDAGGDVARQIAQMEDLIQQEVDAIIIWPTNGEAVIPAVRKAYQEDIPVIVTNSNIAEAGFDFVASFSGPDNVTQGARSAEIMCDRFKELGIENEAKVVHITGQPGYTTAIERAQGFNDRLPEVCPNVEQIDEQPGDWNREKSQQVMEAFLVQYDDIDGVYSGDDNMGVGAMNAAIAAGRADGITFVGATNFAVGYDAMAEGTYWGSIYQSPVDDAEAALKTAIDVLNGEEVPFLNYFDTPKITQDNMDEFTRPVF